MILRDVRRRAKLFLGPSLALCLVLYFAYHLVEGGRGIRAWKGLEQEVVQVRERFEKLEKENAALSRNVNLMKEDICPHLLEEEARKLGYVRDNEIVVIE
jgi:cell division protein FtsB